MKTVLIVEDEPKICGLLAQFFESRGLRSLTAETGHEALARLNEEAPDYLLLDIGMPDVSGLDVLKLAKARHPKLKVIMVTAFGDEQTIETAASLGASDYITKPFGLSEQLWERTVLAAG